MSRVTRVGLSTGGRSFSTTSVSLKAPRRNRRQLAATPGIDVVGPPDPVSNLRPVRYGSAFHVETGTSNGDPDKRKAHPYSLSEFSSPVMTVDDGASSHPFWSSMSGLLRLKQVPHSWYYRELLQRLEVAEMQDRLRRVHSDAFHQRFWRDNNARFERDLHNFQVNPPTPPPQLAQQQAPALEAATDTTPIPVQVTPSTSTPASNEASAADKQPPSDLSVFYQAWLDANTARHRAYNRALIRDVVSRLLPAMDYAWLRIWARVVKRVERVLGWGP